MALDVLAIGTHGKLRTTGDIELLAVGSWGKFPKLGPTEFVVGIQEVTLSSFIAVTYDIESNVFRTHRFRSPIPDSPAGIESFITATQRFISAMLPVQAQSFIAPAFRHLSRMTALVMRNAARPSTTQRSPVGQDESRESQINVGVKEKSNV